MLLEPVARRTVFRNDAEVQPGFPAPVLSAIPKTLPIKPPMPSPTTWIHRSDKEMPLRGQYRQLPRLAQIAPGRM